MISPSYIRPREQVPAALGAEDDAGRELVRRREDDDVAAAGVERGDVDARVVDRDRTRGEPGPLGNEPVRRPPRVLDGDALDAAIGERPAQERVALGEPGA